MDAIYPSYSRCMIIRKARTYITIPLATTVERDAAGRVVRTLSACGRGEGLYTPPSGLRVSMPHLD